MKSILKKAFNIIKLIVGIDLLITTIIMSVMFIRRINVIGKDEFYGTLVAISLFLLIGILLLRSYFKNRTKMVIAEGVIYESNFYKSCKRLIDMFDGYSFNGYGTKYFLYTNKGPDNAVIATKWLILCFFPICPLYRNKIIITNEKDKFYLPFFFMSSSQITILNQEPLNKKLHRSVYIFYYLFFHPAILAPIVVLISHLSFFNQHFPGATFWYLILLYFAWGVFVYFISELFNKRFLLNKTY